MYFLGCAAMGYSISIGIPLAQAKLHLGLATIFPDPLDPLECSLFQVLIFPVGLPSPAK